jgi:hypothetical protein
MGVEGRCFPGEKGTQYGLQKVLKLERVLAMEYPAEGNTQPVVIRTSTGTFSSANFTFSYIGFPGLGYLALLCEGFRKQC